MFLVSHASKHYRGLHIVILNPYSGEVEFAKMFDTYKNGSDFDEFITLNNFDDGYILIAACKDDCVTNLSKDAKYWFADLGSQKIWDLTYRESFAFIAVFGQK